MKSHQNLNSDAVAQLNYAFLHDIRTIITTAQANAVRSVEFYRTYPIANTLRSQFNWFQYRLLISISDSSKREFYELQSALATHGATP